MATSAKKPFFISDRVGLFKLIGSPGYAIKLMGVGRNGVVVGECDDSFNLVSINDNDRQAQVFSALSRLRKKDWTLDFVHKVSSSILTRHYKITKSLDME
jgi:hypothetical protein